MDINCSLDEVTNIYQRIHSSFNVIQHCKNSQNLFKINNFMFRVLTATILRKPFGIYDIPEVENLYEREEIDLWKAMEPYNNAHDPEYTLPNNDHPPSAGIAPMGVDTTSERYKNSIYAADAAVPRHLKRCRSIFQTDVEQRQHNEQGLKIQARKSEEDIGYDDNVEFSIPADPETLQMDSVLSEYGHPILLPSISDTLMRLNINVPKPVIKPDELGEDEGFELGGVYYNYGPLFYDHINKKSKYECLKDDSDRKLKGHATHVLISMFNYDRIQTLAKCQERLVDASEEFTTNIVELVAFSWLNWYYRKLSEKSKEKILKKEEAKKDEGSTINEMEFWNLNDFFEQIGKVYLNCTKLVAVVKDKDSSSYHTIVYPIWHRYVQQIVGVCDQGVKYSCLNECGKEKVSRDDMQDHVEFQLAEGLVCTVHDCGSQFSFSSSYSRHYTIAHIKSQGKGSSTWRRIKTRYGEMKKVPIEQIFASLDSKILERNLSCPVAVPYKAPSTFSSQAGSQADIEPTYEMFPQGEKHYPSLPLFLKIEFDYRVPQTTIEEVIELSDDESESMETDGIGNLVIDEQRDDGQEVSQGSRQGFSDEEEKCGDIADADHDTDIENESGDEREQFINPKKRTQLLSSSDDE